MCDMSSTYTCEGCCSSILRPFVKKIPETYCDVSVLDDL